MSNCESCFELDGYAHRHQGHALNKIVKDIINRFNVLLDIYWKDNVRPIEFGPSPHFPCGSESRGLELGEATFPIGQVDLQARRQGG
jgi:hypothetical protein